MKRNLLIVTGLAVISTGAFASKARMEALGQDGTFGSRFLNDSRNVFRNPSEANTMNKYAIAEWGTTSNTLPATAAANDSVTAPKAEGGFFNTAGNFVYGVYLGQNETFGTAHDPNAFGTVTSNNQYNTRSTGFYQNVNGLDVFVAGDAGVQWGARIHYTAGKDERGDGSDGAGPTTAYDVKQSALGVGFGVTMGDLEAALNVDISDKSEGHTTLANRNDKWEADTGFDLEVSYNWMDWTFYGGYTASGSEATVLTVKQEVSNTEFDFGGARKWDLGAGSMFFADVKYSNAKTEDKITAGTDEITVSKIPVTFGYEGEAASWLTLRGSVSMNLMGSANIKLGGTTPASTSNDKSFKTNTANVAAGATLKLGKFNLDGSIGTETHAGVGAATEAGGLRLDGLMSRVAAIYNF